MINKICSADILKILLEREHLYFSLILLQKNFLSSNRQVYLITFVTTFYTHVANVNYQTFVATFFRSCSKMQNSCVTDDEELLPFSNVAPFVEKGSNTLQTLAVPFNSSNKRASNKIPSEMRRLFRGRECTICVFIRESAAKGMFSRGRNRAP